MAINVVCPGCKRVGKVPASAVGTKIRCKSCGIQSVVGPISSPADQPHAGAAITTSPAPWLKHPLWQGGPPPFHAPATSNRSPRRATVVLLSVIGGLAVVAGTMFAIVASRSAAPPLKNIQNPEPIAARDPDPLPVAPGDWSKKEKENIVHFFRALRLHDGSYELLKRWGEGRKATGKKEWTVDREAYVSLLRATLAEAKVPQHEVLAKAHPALPAMFKNKYVRSVELLVQWVDAGEEVDKESTALHEAWIEWWGSHGGEIRFPDSVPVRSDDSLDSEWIQSRPYVWSFVHVPKFALELPRENNGNQAPPWTVEEKRNLAHFFRSRRAEEEAREGVRRAPGLDDAQVFIRLKAAFGEAKGVRDDVLEKMHPELPSVFRDTYCQYLESSIRLYETHNFEDLGGLASLSRWADWWRANKNDVRVPIDVPY